MPQPAKPKTIRVEKRRTMPGILRWVRISSGVQTKRSSVRSTRMAGTIHHSTLTPFTTMAIPLGGSVATAWSSAMLPADISSSGQDRMRMNSVWIFQNWPRSRRSMTAAKTASTALKMAM